jgi:hypothetical protein
VMEQTDKAVRFGKLQKAYHTRRAPFTVSWPRGMPTRHTF